MRRFLARSFEKRPKTLPIRPFLQRFGKADNFEVAVGTLPKVRRRVDYDLSFAPSGDRPTLMVADRKYCLFWCNPSKESGKPGAINFDTMVELEENISVLSPGNRDILMVWPVSTEDFPRFHESVVLKISLPEQHPVEEVQQLERLPSHPESFRLISSNGLNPSLFD